MATKSQKAKQAAIDLCTKYIGQPDRWGHFKKIDSEGKQYRIKIQKTSWRLELYIGKSWLKLHGAFYTKDSSKSLNSVIYRFFNKDEELVK